MGDYYTVTQFASINGKDVGNIRRMLINGSIEGKKVGNQWLIPKETSLPKDRRMKNGNYRNWRQKNSFNKNYPQLSRSIKYLCEDLKNVYDNKLESIVLYGSYARGEENEESDIDMAIILRDDQTEEQHNRMTDIVVDYELDLGITLSVISIETSNYRTWKEVLPFYKNLNKDGIVLWKSE